MGSIAIGGPVLIAVRGHPPTLGLHRQMGPPKSIGTEGRHGSRWGQRPAGPMQQAVRDALIGLMAAHHSGTG